MIRYQINIATILLLLLALSCKKEMTLSEYKYANNNYTVECQDYQLELMKEAVYSFEDDILKHFEKKGSKNLSQAYSRYVNLSSYGRLQYNEIISDHSKELLNILRAEDDLWSQTSNGWSLNYSHPIVSCISNNMKDKDLQTTFNALLSTNSMSQKLFADAIKRVSYKAIRDKSLATYIALDLYFANLIDANLESPEAKQPIKADPHAGHNH